MDKELFEMWVLEAYLGAFVDKFDVEAIIEEATEIDYKTGDRYWKDEVNLGEICKKHEIR